MRGMCAGEDTVLPSSIYESTLPYFESEHHGCFRVVVGGMPETQVFTCMAGSGPDSSQSPGPV